MSIRQKLVTSLIAITVCVAILGVVTFRFAEASLDGEVNAGLERLAVTSSEHVDSLIESVIFEVENLAGTPWIEAAAAENQGPGANSDTELAKEFIQVVNLSYSLDGLTLINTNGSIIASTDSSGDSQRRAQALGMPAPDGTEVSESYSVGGERYVSMSTAVYFHGVLVGHLVADFPVERLLNLNPDEPASDSPVAIQILEFSDDEAVLLTGAQNAASLKPDVAALVDAAGGQEVVLVERANSEGTEYVSACIGLESVPWVLSVSLDKQSAYSGLQGVRRVLVSAFVVAFMVLFVGALLVSRSVTGRLERVSMAVEAVSSGDLRRRVIDSSDDELGKISQAFDTMADKLARRLSEERAMRTKLEQQAFFDALTGLPNRHSFESHIDRALSRSSRDGKDIGVLFLDLDGFKRVNDSVGHAVGDEVLRALSVRLGSSMRAFDTVARWGGDEFVVLCEAIESPDDAVIVARRLIAEVEVPFEIAGKTRSISVSIGVAVGNGKTHTRQDLINSADAAMYQAKDLGPSQFVMGTTTEAGPTDSDGSRARVVQAMEENELRVEFQPIVCLESRRLSGVEAFVRWQHPEKGLIGAEEILSAVRGSSLAARLDDWVLETSIAMFAEWCRKYPSAGGLFLSVNLGVDRLSEPGLEQQIRGCLDRNELAPVALCLEIPDVPSDSGSGADDASLANLVALGVTLTLDTNAERTENLPDDLASHSISTVKVDSSVLRSANREDVDEFEQLIEQAHRRHITVIAEGVESESQVELLRRLGCDLAQGYHFSKPLAVFAIEQQISVMETAEP